MNDMFARECEARSQQYAFLARLFREEPDIVFLEGLREGGDAFSGALGDYARLLAMRDIEAERADAAADFAYCFLGMSDDPVSPFESVWRSPSHLMMQEPRDEVVAAYAAQGMGKDASFGLPEDHISIELEFMAHLCKRCGEAFRDGDAARLGALEVAQENFFKAHLDAWVGDVCDKLERRCKTDYLRAVALTTREVIGYERAYIDGVL